MNARSTSRVNVRPTFFCAGARDPSGSLGGLPLNAADGPKAARLLERCAAGPQLLTEVELPVFVMLDDRLGSVAPVRRLDLPLAARSTRLAQFGVRLFVGRGADGMLFLLAHGAP